MTTYTKPNPSFKTLIYKRMSDYTDAVSIFFYSPWLILFISLTDLLPALSSAAGVRFNPPWTFAPLITNWAVPYSTELSCTWMHTWPKSWLHTHSPWRSLKQWWEEKSRAPKDPFRNKNLKISPILWDWHTCALKNAEIIVLSQASEVSESGKVSWYWM